MRKNRRLLLHRSKNQKTAWETVRSKNHATQPEEDSLTHEEKKKNTHPPTIVEAEVVGQLSPDDALLHEGFDSVRVSPRRLHAHHRGLGAHLPEVEIRRHVGAHVLVWVVGQIREALDARVDEGLEVGAGPLRSWLEPADLWRVTSKSRDGHVRSRRHSH